MHELSIAQGIIEVAERQAIGHPTKLIEELELEIGQLAGVDLATLEFALVSAVKGTKLEKAKIVRHDIPGEGVCENCGSSMAMPAVFLACPSCGSYQVKIVRGRELRVKSIVVS